MVAIELGKTAGSAMMQQGERCASLHKGILPHILDEKPHLRPQPGGSQPPSHLDRCAREADFGSARLLARTNSVEYIAKFDKHANAAADRGVFGSPTKFVDEEMFFGNDVVDFVAEAVRAAAEDRSDVVPSRDKRLPDLADLGGPKAGPFEMLTPRMLGHSRITRRCRCEPFNLPRPRSSLAVCRHLVALAAFLVQPPPFRLSTRSLPSHAPLPQSRPAALPQTRAEDHG
jgi:hypothetical protein